MRPGGQGLLPGQPRLDQLNGNGLEGHYLAADFLQDEALFASGFLPLEIAGQQVRK
jgi:hypothetical protein